jgi:hypothetical protein
MATNVINVIGKVVNKCMRDDRKYILVNAIVGANVAYSLTLPIPTIRQYCHATIGILFPSTFIGLHLYLNHEKIIEKLKK